MPRQGRIHIPGGIYHIIVRGIERRPIFRDAKDRIKLLSQLGKGLKKKNIHCYAWTLMTNHAHLLLSPTDRPLSELLHSQLTSYAKYFNRKYKRIGHLFQNRYKSILCQRDNYFLELIRYIHQNPIRAGIVGDLKELSKYPWSGHSTLLVNHKRKWQNTKGVLSMFGRKKNIARRAYMDFMKDKLEQYCDELEGGGVRRSQKGWQRTGHEGEEPWASDERILGDTEYVIDVLGNVDEKINEAEYLKRAGWDLERLSEVVCGFYDTNQSVLKRKLCYNKAKEAKAMIACLAKIKLKIKSIELARYFEVGKSAITYLVTKGEKNVGKKNGNWPFEQRPQ